MKRLNNLYNDICNLDNIVEVSNKVCSKVKSKKRVDVFETYKSEHLISIKNKLEDRCYNPGKYNIFMITDPKCRIVMSQNIEDKIINHLVGDYILVRAYENVHTNSMCATRIGKGTHYGIRLLKNYLVKMKNKYNKFYYLKLDIKKYFYNIDHDILKSILRKKIKDKDALNILNSIIDSTNKEYINSEIENIKARKINYLKNSNIKNKEYLISEIENIPLYKYNKGCPIGDQTSQAFGLIYLDEFNHFLKEKLHLKYVINYMDDFVILHENKEYLKYCLERIKNKLKEYKLELNDKKSKIDGISNGIDFLGFRFYIKNNKIIMKLRNNTKKRFKKKCQKFNMLLKYKYLSSKEYNDLLASYKGHLKWGNCSNLCNKYVM